jgi:hypothetical protein
MTKASKRTELNEAFIHQLALDFEVHGADVIEKLRLTDLRAYSQLVAALVPKKVEVEEKSSAFDSMSQEQVEDWLVGSFAQDLKAAERLLDKARALAASGDPIVTILPDDDPPSKKSRSRHLGLPRG